MRILRIKEMKFCSALEVWRPARKEMMQGWWLWNLCLNSARRSFSNLKHLKKSSRKRNWKKEKRNSTDFSKKLNLILVRHPMNQMKLKRHPGNPLINLNLEFQSWNRALISYGIKMWQRCNDLLLTPEIRHFGMN